MIDWTKQKVVPLAKLPLAQVAQRAYGSVVGQPFRALGGVAITQPGTPGPYIGSAPVKLDDILVGTDLRYPNATSQITFLNPSNVGTILLPTGFRDLQIRWLARGDTPATEITIAVRFNNDSGSGSYRSETTWATGTTQTVQEFVTNETSGRIGLCPAGNATAGFFGRGQADLTHYQSTVNGAKTISSTFAASYTTATGNQKVGQFMAVWASFTAMTRIDVFASAGNFIVGSLFSLWGIP